MDQQETKHFAKSTGLSVVSLAVATSYSYHAGAFSFLDSVQIWGYLVRKCSRTQNWTRRSKNIRN